MRQIFYVKANKLIYLRLYISSIYLFIIDMNKRSNSYIYRVSIVKYITQKDSQLSFEVGVDRL